MATQISKRKLTLDNSELATSKVETTDVSVYIFINWGNIGSRCYKYREATVIFFPFYWGIKGAKQNIGWEIDEYIRKIPQNAEYHCLSRRSGYFFS